MRSVSFSSQQQLFGFLKGKSAVLIHRTVLKKKRVSGLHFWARGYCVRTVGIEEKLVKDERIAVEFLSAHQPWLQPDMSPSGS